MYVLLRLISNLQELQTSDIYRKSMTQETFKGINDL